MAYTNNLPINYSVSGDIVSANVDLLKCDIPNASSVSVVRVSINSAIAATGGEVIEVTNAANGAGTDTISVTFSAGEYFAYSTGDMSLTDFAWIRSGDTVNTLADINTTIRYQPS